MTRILRGCFAICIAHICSIVFHWLVRLDPIVLGAKTAFVIDGLVFTIPIVLIYEIFFIQD